MAELFCDTSGWGHLVDPTQTHHVLSSELYRTARDNNRKIITTNYIISELVALFTSPLRIPMPTTIAFIESLKSSDHIEVVHIDQNSRSAIMGLACQGGQNLESRRLRKFRSDAGTQHH